MKNSFNEKHKIELSGVLEYLHNPVRDDENPFKLFSQPNHVVIKNHLKDIIQGLDQENNYENTDVIEENESKTGTAEGETLTLKKDFKNKLTNICKRRNRKSKNRVI